MTDHRHSPAVLAIALSLLCILPIGGCNPPTSSQTDKASTAQQSESPKETAAITEPSSVTTDETKPAVDIKGPAQTPVDAAGLQAAIGTYKGKVVLVDYWATWCIACVAGLPKTAELGREHAEQGLVVMTMSMDDLEDETLSREMLADSGIDSSFPNLISKIGGEEAAMEEFGIEGGSLPHYRIYDRDGTLMKKFVMGDPDNVWDHTDVVIAVEEALAK